MSRRGAPAMPRITEAQVLELVKAGKYKVCPRTAEVIGPKGKAIAPHPCNGRKGGSRLYVRLYGFGGVRTVALARLVWISVVGQPLPGPDWEVHHRDECNNSDGWDNLIACHRLDHRKIHYGHCDHNPEKEAPF
jgi:hypothetical protein